MKLKTRRSLKKKKNLNKYKKGSLRVSLMYNFECGECDSYYRIIKLNKDDRFENLMERETYE